MLPESGKTYDVPDNMAYKEWEKAFVNGDKSGLTNAENGGIIKVENNKAITPISDKAIERVKRLKTIKNETNIEIDKFISTLFKVTKAGVVFNGRK